VGEIADALKRAREEARRGEEGRAKVASDPISEVAETVASVAPIVREASAGTPVGSGFASSSSQAAHIAAEKEDSWVARAVLADHHGRFAGYFRQFALRVRTELKAMNTNVVLVTSAISADGKTTVSCNLALALASMAAGRRIALVECDLRRPSIGKALGVPTPLVGVEKVLTGAASLDSARLATDAGIDLFLAVEPDSNAHLVFSNDAFERVLREFSDRYDTVVIDSPPVLAVADVSLMINHVDACITVARSGVTPLSAYRAMLDTLPARKVIGAFVNNSDAQNDSTRYGYYGESGPNGKSG
jgi:capsular exopolysaccharide synthesis family protein